RSVERVKAEIPQPKAIRVCSGFVGWPELHSCTLAIMSKRYSIAEARSKLATIVDEAEAGLEIELTRRGKPVAVVVSLRQLERLRGGRPRFSDVYKAFLSKLSLEDIDLENDFFRFVREKSVGRKVSL